MFDLVRLAQATLFAAFRSRRRLVVENLLLRWFGGRPVLEPGGSPLTCQCGEGAV